VRVNGHLAVGRLGIRTDGDLAWEAQLLQDLDREGVAVPVPIPTLDGRLFADGLVVMTYLVVSCPACGNPRKALICSGSRALEDLLAPQGDHF